MGSHMQDSDVHAEASRVLSGDTTDNDIIIMKNLVKVLDSQQLCFHIVDIHVHALIQVYAAHLSGRNIKPSKRAVDGINLAIPNGECFGLLGVNGK